MSSPSFGFSVVESGSGRFSDPSVVESVGVPSFDRTW